MVAGKDRLFKYFCKSKPLHYKSGDIILRPDDIPSGIYYIEKGFVKVYSITEEGDEKLHVIYKPRELFPLIWVFKGITKDIFYEALGDVILRRLSKNIFLKLVKEDNLSLLSLIDRIIALFDIHVDRIDNLELTKSYPRLVARLLFLAKRFGKIRGKKIIIEVPIAHKDIANSINMTRETASRELERLEKLGLIKYQDHLIVITDISKLKQELSIHYERIPL